MTSLGFSRAVAFRVWRAATAVQWQTTAADLAAELGLGGNIVRLVLRTKGWKLADPDQNPMDHNHARFGNVVPVDHQFARAPRQVRQRDSLWT